MSLKFILPVFALGAACQSENELKTVDDQFPNFGIDARINPKPAMLAPLWFASRQRLMMRWCFNADICLVG